MYDSAQNAKAAGRHLIRRGGVTVLGPVHLVMLGAYLALSITAFALYGWDKAAARRGGRRTPEMALHLIALAGGWPGALLGQRVFRHKTVKQPFRAVFWCTVALNCAGAAWLIAATSTTWP